MNKICQNIKSKMMNKKHLMAPICLLLIATMIITPLANALPTTTAYVTNVESSYGVSNPENVKAKDGNYAIFDGLASKIVVKFTTNPSSVATIKIYAYAFSGTPKVKCYSGPTATGGWSQTGQTNGTPIGSAGWYTVGTLNSPDQYAALSNTGGSLYIDQIIIEY